MNFVKYILSLLSSLYIFGCIENTTYSGKIISQNDLTNLKILNKDELINKFGAPSFEDTVQNKYFYYTEMNKETNFYNQKTEYSFLFMFEFDINDKIIRTQAVNLLDKNEKTFQKKITKNEIIERGLIEKIFGGVGPNQLPNSQ